MRANVRGRRCARSASQSACATAGRYADLIRILHAAYIRMLKDYTCARGLVRTNSICIYCIFTCLTRSGKTRAVEILLRKREGSIFFFQLF